MAPDDDKDRPASTADARADLIAELVTASEAEASARHALHECTAELAARLAAARAAGLDDDFIARKLLRHRLGRAPTMEERRKERERVKKRRHRGTTSPIKDLIGAKNELTRDTRRVRSAEEGKKMPEHLIRRKTVTTEEEFAVENDEDEQEEESCDADTKAAAGDDGDDEDDEEGEEDEA